jgi:hypothetical protein
LNHRLMKLKSCFNFRLAALLLAGLMGTAQAADDAAPPPPADNTNTQDQPAAAPPPPLPPDGVKSDDSRNIPQPEVNIIHRKDATIEEYRINGQLRYIKVVPKKGKPYYLVDHDGDGVLESRQSDLKGPPQVNKWIIKQW